MKTYRFSIVIEKNEEGYFAFCPELQGCYTQGDTYEEVLENIKDAIRLHVNERLPRITAVEMQSFQWKSSKNY
jgi:predicted RNase H-like HicB family nuclease